MKGFEGAPSEAETNEVVAEQFKDAIHTVSSDFERSDRASAEEALETARSIAEAMFDETQKVDALAQVDAWQEKFDKAA